MAEKIIIGEVDLNIDKATKDAQSLKQTISLLKEEMKKAKDAGGETSKEYIELQAALKTTQKEYNSQINIIGKSIQADTAKKGSLEQMRAQLSVVSAQWAALSEDERKNTDEGKRLTKQKKDLTEALTKEEKATGDARRQVGFYEKGMQDANQAVGTFIPGATQATGAAKALGVALKVMLGPIGLLIAAIAAVVGAIKAFFTSSEEGQNVLRKFQAVFQVVFGNIIDIVSKFGEALINAVTKPRETWEKFTAFIERVGAFFQNTFGNIIGGFFEKQVAQFLKGFAAIGLAWQKLKGVFTDNAEGINKAQERISELNGRIEDGNDRIKKGAEGLGNSVRGAWNRAKEGLSEYVKEQEREINIAKRLADQQAELDKQIRDNLVLEAKDRLELEKLKNQVENKNQLTAEERIALLDQENEILDRIAERNLDIAQQKYEIQKAQNALSNSTKEDLEKEAQLQAEIFKAEQAVESQRREAITKRQEAEREILAEKKAQVDEEVRLLNERIEKEKELEEEERQRKLEQLQLDFENEYAIREGNLFGQLELERIALEQRRLQELEYAEKIGADTEKVNQKYAKAQRSLDRAEFNAKLSLAGGFTKDLATIFGEQSAVGKAAAVAGATIATIQSAVNSFNSLAGIPIVGPALGATAAAAALASGYAQVKQILSVKSGLPEKGVSSSGGGRSSSGYSGSQAVIPTTTSASVGQGIVSRDTTDTTTGSIASGVSQALLETPLQPTLVTDDVTVNQEQDLSKNRTSSI